MEEPQTPKSLDDSNSPSPVMDVVPPRSAPQPTSDFSEPIAQEHPEKKHPQKHRSDSKPDLRHKEAPRPSVPKPPKQPGSGVGLAIFATVIIVLGLAALATYAYLKANGDI